MTKANWDTIKNWLPNAKILDVQAKQIREMTEIKQLVKSLYLRDLVNNSAVDRKIGSHTKPTRWLESFDSCKKFMICSFSEEKKD